MLVNLSNILHRKGHSVSVLTTVEKGPLSGFLEKDITIINLERKWKWNLLTMYFLIKKIRHFDIIHVHSSYNLRYLFLASRIFMLGKPIFFHEHFGDINIDQHISWHTKYIYPKTIMIAVSRQIAEWAINKVHMAEKHVFVLPNTVIKENIKNSSFKSRQVINLLVVSNLRPTKNIIAAIQVLEALLLQKNNFHLTIIGQIANTLYYKKIKEYIKEKHLESYADIQTNCTNIQAIAHEYDLALHTATSESGPLVLIEYIAQGLPFISYNTGEVVQQIKNDLPEFIMPSFHIEEWVKQVHLILTMDQYSLQKKMQETFDRYYSVEAYYETCMEIYAEGLQL